MSKLEEDLSEQNNDTGNSEWRPPTYRPNYIDLDTRAVCLVGSTLLICYAVASIINDDFFIWLPGRRTTGYIHLHGTPIWFACAAVFSACLSMLSIVVDHYDTRDNEMKYKRFARLTFKAAIGLLFLAMFVDGVYFKTGSGTIERNWPL